MGRPVSLPCFYPQLLTFKNFTIAWREEDKVVLRSVFENGRNIEELSADGGTLSLNATEAGDFSLELPAVDPGEDKRNYGLFIISEANQSDALCTVCLRIAGQCTQTQQKPTFFQNIWSTSTSNLLFCKLSHVRKYSQPLPWRSELSPGASCFHWPPSGWFCSLIGVDLW